MKSLLLGVLIGGSCVVYAPTVFGAQNFLPEREEEARECCCDRVMGCIANCALASKPLVTAAFSAYLVALGVTLWYHEPHIIAGLVMPAIRPFPASTVSLLLGASQILSPLYCAGALIAEAQQPHKKIKTGWQRHNRRHRKRQRRETIALQKVSGIALQKVSGYDRK